MGRSGAQRARISLLLAYRHKHDAKLSNQEKERILNVMLDQMKSPKEMEEHIDKHIHSHWTNNNLEQSSGKGNAKVSVPTRDIRKTISIVGLPDNHDALNLYLLKFIAARDVEMCRQIYDKLKSLKRSLPFDAINNSTSIKFMTLLVEEEGVQAAIEFAKYYRNTFLIYRGGRAATRFSLERLLTAALNAPGDEADVLLQAETLRSTLLRTGNVHEDFNSIINPFVDHTLKRHGWSAALKTYDREQRLFRQYGGHQPLMQYIIDHLDKRGDELKAAYDLEPSADEAFCSLHVLLTTVWRITERYSMAFGVFNAEFIVLLLRSNRKEEAWMVSDHNPNIDDIKLKNAIHKLISDFSTPDTKLIQDLIELLGRRSDILKPSLRLSPRLGLAEAIRDWLISCHKKHDTTGALAAIDAFKEHDIPIDDGTFALAVKVFEDAGVKPPSTLNPVKRFFME
uniref:Uncharacterized protein n=1 Tax=Plectus sambesii TaxID=2011161 RepID=A0A914UUG7_9BILA